MQRRSFLKQATLGAAAGGAALAAPWRKIPTIHWRLASSFPRSADAIFTGGENLAKYVSEATDGKFSIRAFPAGEIVPALQVLDAVQNGTIECGHTASYYYFGKDPALCFDGAVPFGLNTRQMNAWMRHGDGLKLTRELFQKYNVVNFPCGYTGTQMGGWFRNEIKSVDDLKGLKFRASAFAGAVLSRLGWCRSRLPAAISIPPWKKAPSTRPNGSVRTTTRNWASTRWPRTTISPAGGKARCRCRCTSTRTSTTSCPSITRRRWPRPRRPPPTT